MQKIELSAELVNAILNYLGSQPFVHVSPLISAIQKEAQGQVTPEPTIEE